MPDKKLKEAAQNRPPRPAATGVIRPYRSSDRAMVREIFRRTAYRNKGADTVFEDTELFADYWTRYYTDFEPESSLILEEDGEIIGYLTGCMDSRNHVRVMSRQIVPPVLAKALWRLVTFQYKQPTTRKLLYWLLTRGWREVPEIPVERYPAHYHANVLRKGYGKKYHSALAMKFLELMDSRGVPGLQGQIEEPAISGPWRAMVQRFIDDESQTVDLELFAEKPSSLQYYVLGVDKPMVNRAWGGTTDNFRQFMAWARQNFGI